MPGSQLRGVFTIFSYQHNPLRGLSYIFVSPGKTPSRIGMELQLRVLSDFEYSFSTLQVIKFIQDQKQKLAHTSSVTKAILSFSFSLIMTSNKYFQLDNDSISVACY